MVQSTQDLQIIIKGPMMPGQTDPEWPSAPEREGKFALDPQQIPDWVYQTASRALNTCIRRALSTPEGRASYEAWLKEMGEE